MPILLLNYVPDIFTERCSRLYSHS